MYLIRFYTIVTVFVLANIGFLGHGIIKTQEWKSSETYHLG